MGFAYFALLGRIFLLGYEKIIVKKLGDNSNSVAATFLFFLTATLFLLPFIFIIKKPENYNFLIYILFSSFVYSIAFVLYVKSLSEADASLVGPLYNFNVFFLLLLTAIFLNEKITIYKIIGLILLIYGASFLNKQQNFYYSLKILFKERATYLMIISSFLIAAGRTIDGFVVQKIAPLNYAFYLYLFITMFLLMFLIVKRNLYYAITLFKEKPKIAFVSGSVNAFSYFMLLIAFTKIDVSVAEPMSMLSMIVTVILAHFIFKENIKNRIIGVFIMIIGAWLLYLS